jgi:hypothetical protein
MKPASQLLFCFVIAVACAAVATMGMIIFAFFAPSPIKVDETNRVHHDAIPPNMMVLGDGARTDIPIPEVVVEEVVEMPEVDVVEIPRAEDIVDHAYREAFKEPLVKRYTNPPEHIVVEINWLRSERNRKIREMIKSGVDVDAFRHWIGVYRKEYHDKADWLIQSQIDPTWAPHDERFKAKLRAQLAEQHPKEDLK